LGAHSRARAPVRELTMPSSNNVGRTLATRMLGIGQSTNSYFRDDAVWVKPPGKFVSWVVTVERTQTVRYPKKGGFSHVLGEC
jgi:hypothetical protein